jgi:phosphatidylglycerol:prolipoprotein diacylglycerol transferase
MIAFSISGFDIHRYGIFYAISFTIGYVFLNWFSKSSLFPDYNDIKNVLKNHLDELFIVLILGVLIWWRLGHCFIYYPTYYIHNPLDIFKIWEGGMSFIWGFIWVFIWVLRFKRRHKLTSTQLLKISDILLVFLPGAIALGRIGNYLNQELYGIKVPSDFRGLGNGYVNTLKQRKFFTVYTNPEAWEALRVNTNFLAAIGEGILILILQIICLCSKWYTKHPGALTWQFILTYSAIRFFLEYLRADSNEEFIGLFTISQYYFIVGILIGTRMLYHVFTHIKKSNA